MVDRIFEKIQILNCDKEFVLELKGKYNTAKVFNDFVETTAISQIIELCNQEFFKDSKIRIMSDCHSGKGCVIGTTMTVQDKLVPNLIGVDISCGVDVFYAELEDIDFKKMDNFIREKIPSGFNIRGHKHRFAKLIKKDLEKLKCFKHIDFNRALLSVGTLGGGNHMIEIGKDSKNITYFIVHSGSRHLGNSIARYYQEEAYEKLISGTDKAKKLIASLKAQGRRKDISKELVKLKNSLPRVNKELAYCEGNLFDDYVFDMKIINKFAYLNRRAILVDILSFLKIDENNGTFFTTLHNYLDTDAMILRKGAVEASKGKLLIIPMNMRDGCLLCRGKGNPDWNFSAPHGAGRLMSRGKAKEVVSLEEFEESMKNVYTTSVGQSTLDEAPMVYKKMEEIVKYIEPAVEILEVVKPLYNFKAG